MTKLKIWIQAARLRTLPVGLSSVLLGNVVAYYFSLKFNFTITFFSVLTTILLQVLSNYANDLGDFLNGADTIGQRADRALSSNKLTKNEMLFAIKLVSFLSLLSGIALLYFSFISFDNYNVLLFFIIGILSISAAIFYTYGKKPYGYYALGDVSVFIFFGIVSIIGITFLHLQKLNTFIFLPAISMGLLSVATLNVNNIRDISSDKLAGKVTIPVIIGVEKSFIYQLLLISFSVIFLNVFFIFCIQSKIIYISNIGIILLLKHLHNLYKNKYGDRLVLTNELKNLSISILVYIGLISILMIYIKTNY